MRKIMWALAGTFLLFSNTYAVTNHGNICSVLSNHPSWYQIAKKTEQKWGVPVQVQMAIMRTESDFKANAKARTSTAYGYAQVINRTWRAYQKDTHSNARRNDFRAASDFIGWYAGKMNTVIGISADDPYALYVAYHDGGGGYKKAIKNKSSFASRLAKKVARDAVRYESQLSDCDVVDNSTPTESNTTSDFVWSYLPWMNVSI